MTIEGWPDARRFSMLWEHIVTAAQYYPHVMMFGEMVALRFNEGQHGAAVQLEELWSELATRSSFSLLCAYPLEDMARGSSEAMSLVCCEHALAIPSERLFAHRER